MNKNLDYYMNLPYKIMLIPDEDGVWFAEIPELPGCITEADSKEEALASIEDAKLEWLSVALRHGDSIPEPERETT